MIARPFTVLIPARLASTRLPNKPLADIAGVPMVVRVAQRVAGLAGRPLLASHGGMSGTGSTQNLPEAPRVVVAADCPDIIAACQAHGVQAVLTRSDHASGSDRLAEACGILGLPDGDIVVNVQGDEPLIDPSLVWAVANLLAERPQASMSTAAHVIDTLADFHNPNVVKVVLDASGMAQYFSRASIPYARDFVLENPRDFQASSTTTSAAPPWWQNTAALANRQLASALQQSAPLRHIGIYGYRAGFLRLFPTLAQAPLEQVEALEQLRAMWHGHRIAVHVTAHAPGPGVDTPQDLERVRQHFGQA